MSAKRFAGLHTALVTPFLDDGPIDERALAVLVERQISAGVSGVVVGTGEAGEAATLRPEELRRLIGLCVEIADGRVSVIAGASANATGAAIALVRQAADLGAAAALVMTPWYNRPSQEGLFRHFEAVSQDAALPILVGDAPERSGVGLRLETFERLGELRGLVGCLDASGDLGRQAALRRACPDWTWLGGHDALAMGYLAQGGDGWVSLVANVVPRPVRAFATAWARGELSHAAAWHGRLGPLSDLIGDDPIPAVAKLALSMFGLCGAAVRLPITPAPQACRARLNEAMLLAAWDGALGDNAVEPRLMVRTARQQKTIGSIEASGNR